MTNEIKAATDYISDEIEKYSEIAADAALAMTIRSDTAPPEA